MLSQYILKQQFRRYIIGSNAEETVPVAVLIAMEFR